MNKFKLDVHSKQTFKLTIENIDEHIGRKNPWFQCINGRDGCERNLFGKIYHRCTIT